MGNAPVEKIRDAIHCLEKTLPKNMLVHKLAGDASDRRYFRVEYDVGSLHKGYVVMDILDVQNICKSEEVTLYHDESGELPFLNIHRFLQQVQAPVPEVAYFNREQGLMLLEDLGDRLLLYAAEQSDAGEIFMLYSQAVDQMIRMQVNAKKLRRDTDCMAFDQTFAPELLAWEFEHYLEYGIEALHGVKVTNAERKTLKVIFRDLAERISSFPRAFTHRDYHSRNLIDFEGRLVMIDFQDALYGPRCYDLASLLRDSYIDLGEMLRERLLAHFLKQYDKFAGGAPDEESFRREFDLVAMQRNLKAAGRFVFIDLVKGNPAYLESIPRTLRYVAGDFNRHPELEPLADILCKYEPRLRGRE